MRHRRGIDLAPAAEQVAELQRATLASLPQWFVLVAYCHGCQRKTLIDRWALARSKGKEIPLSRIAARLKCTACDNASESRLLLGKLPRD
jgi:hypothetical protein